ncbi:hypothetical protein BH20ACT4_BH20ACT4_05390 [soil metagenome]
MTERRLFATFAAGVIISLAACGGDSTPESVQDGLPMFEGGGGDPAIGMGAPAISGEDYSGKPSSFVPGEGRPTLLVFLAHWCGHCIAEIPRILEWDASGAVPDKLDIVGISTGATDTRDNYPPGEWLEESGWRWPVIADDEQEYRFAGLYGLTATPFLVLVGSDGKVVARAGGEKSVAELTELVSPIAG